MKIIEPVSLFSTPAEATTNHHSRTARRCLLTDEDSISQRQVNHHQHQHRPSSQAEPSASENTSKFHRAAIDGYIDMLCDASRRDTNFASQLDGFTPTLLAAHSGQLEALRILVGRGGDPERTTTNGRSGLHLAAARGHLNCASFLVNFGVNMWALDNDLHTAKDVAAIEQRKEVLDYLDQVMAKQSALNTKNVQKLKEKAKVGAEKRLKQMRKAQLKAIKQIERDERYLARLSNNRRLLKSAHSISDIRLVCKQPGSSGESSAAGSGSGSGSGSSRPGSSVASSVVGSDISYSSSMVSTSPIGSLLAAVNRRRSPQQQQQLASSSPASRAFFGPNLKQLQPAATTRILTMTAANHSLLNQSSSLSSSPSSSDESNNSSLSSSTSAPFLPPQANRQQQQQQQQSSSSQTTKNNRPKYSELVAIRKLDSESQNKTTAGSSSSNNNNSGVVLTPTRIANNSTSIGSKLTKGLGGVSRKVHLKKFLQIAGSTSDLTAAAAADEPKTICQKPLGSSSSSSSSSAAAIRWPPAPTLSRAISEPDFGQFVDNQQQQQRDNYPDTGSSQCRASLAAQTETKTLRRQRLPDEDRQCEDNKDESQHKLLTQCLTQLKMRHEQSSCPPPSTHKHDSSADHRNNTDRSGHSQELLLHRRLNGGANERLIRPSVIKQQLQQQQQHAVGQAVPDIPLMGSIDSIGSVSSLVDRNNPSASKSSNPIVTPSSSSSASSSSYSSSYTNSSCKTSVEPSDKNHHCQARHAATTMETMDTFLQSSGLSDLSEVFSRERIDLEALVLLTEDDLKSLNILLGPRRKLLKAIEDRRQQASSSAKTLQHLSANGCAKYTMVDTVL